MSKQLKKDSAKLRKSEGTVGRHKKFDRDTYNMYNTPAIERVLDYLDGLGIYGKVNPDTYGPDIVVYSGFHATAYIEVEVVTRWMGETFPWDNVHILARKKKYLDLGLPISFYRLNSQLTHAIVIQDIAVTEDRFREVKNSVIAEGEFMYCIPTEECEIIQIMEDL